MVTLEAIKLFYGLNAVELQALRSITRELKFAAGQEIFREGSNGDGVYVVKEGLVEISGLVGTDVRLVLSQVGPGEIFGEMAVIESKPRSACATARADTSVYFIPRAEMLSLVEHSPALSFALLREISRRLREFNRHYLREVLQTERLAVIGRFSRSIVHDLKNPLNIIGLTAEIAGMEKASPEVRQQAKDRIRKQVDRISELISEILEFTQASPSNFVLAPANNASFVKQLIDELTPEVQLKAATIVFESPPPEIDLLVHPKRLRRVFFNLLHNATDAMPDGGKIRLRFVVSEDEVITEVHDSGPGIAPEMTAQLFEAFATHGKAHGTGLGLSICKRIMDDHHGWIAARNDPGAGAVFSFGIPRRPPELKVK